MILRHRLSSFAIAVSAALTAHAQSSPIEMSQNFGKLFKNPISERWGKQICLN